MFSILIATYNNSRTLQQVLEDVFKYSENIIVVNDGSTDNTLDIIKKFPEIILINHNKNLGKGKSLRDGFKKANEMGFEYVITIDSDAQHFPSDIPSFINEYKNNPGSLIIGARNMQQEGIPGKSSFGHKFSNFWFKVETGITALDTQSGFRLYPVLLLKDIHFFTNRFEFEIEVIVRAAWKGIPVRFIPVNIYYEQGPARITHFRPFRDFTRVSILNIFLVIIAFAYIKPRDFLRKITDRKRAAAYFRENILSAHESNARLSASVAFGLFMGIVPVWGFQLVIAIFLAVILRLNKPLVIIAANISIPPMLPFIIYASYQTGILVMGKNATHFSFSKNLSLETLTINWIQYLYGSILLAIVAGLSGGLLSFVCLKIFRRKEALN